MPKQRPDVEEALSWLDQVSQEPDGAKRASLYAMLADRYRVSWQMYGRAIEMYRKSLEAHDNWEDSDEVRMRLAKLLIHLYGRDGFKEAEALKTARISQAIRIEIERKKAAIERHEQKVALERQCPVLKAVVGESQNILEVCQKIIQYAASTRSVLITGDSGTGKEVVARAIAEVSNRMFGFDHRVGHF